MSCLSVNSLFAHGRQIYTTCASFRDKSLEACQRIAKRVWNEATERGVRLGYRFGPEKFFNVMVRLNMGLSIEEMKQTKLHQAAYWGKSADIDAVLAKGADVNAKNWQGWTPLHYAAFEGLDEGCRSLLKKGANIEAKHSDGETPLLIAANRGKRDVVRTLLKAKADVDAKNSRGTTPLHWAAIRGRTDIIGDLLEADANIEIKNIAEETALHVAARNGKRNTVRALLKARANFEAKDVDGDSPLHSAARKGSVGIVNDLLKAGASHAVKTAKGNTPLHLAVMNENKEAVRALVAAGADIHAMNAEALCPLHVSVENIEILRILLDTEPHPAFASLIALHNYCDKIFPASRDRLPVDWEAWIKKIRGEKDPFQELQRVFAKYGPIIVKNRPNSSETSQATHAHTPESIVQFLIRESPVFAKAWAMANRDQKLNLIETSTDVSLNNQQYAPAGYNPFSHEIIIKKNIADNWKVYFVIFEVLNAMQREHQLRIRQLAKLGEVGREEFALLIENMEYQTLYWTHLIEGMALPPNFTWFWKVAHSPVARCKDLHAGYSSHADLYRKQWDLIYAAPYLKKHPELDIA